MATIPAHNPQIPFLGRIPGGFRASLMIKIKGKVTVKKGRFTIDFLETPALDGQQNIIFHTSVRLDQSAMVRNSFINNRWGPEDRYGKFDFKHNKTFEILYLAEPEFYKIAVNGTHIGVYRHRLPLNLVNFIHIKGDVEVEHIFLEQDINTANAVNVLNALKQQGPIPLHGISAATTSTPVFNPIPTQGITAVTSSTQAYVPFQPAPAPQIQISYQPPNQSQMNPVYPPQMPQNPYQPPMPYGQNQPPPPYNPQWR